MNVMQQLAEWKQNLHSQAHPTSNGATPTRGAAMATPAGTYAGAQVTGSRSASSPSTDADSTTITANDFLQLLVAEMKNQDPTADQDPNAYIDQLVQVNSLQQLIAINQDLTPASSDAAHGVQRRPALGSGADSPAASVASALTPQSRKATAASASSTTQTPHPASNPVVASAPNPSAARVATALRR